MAGAGYKLFNTGDVLTAAQVNTYLQEQVVMVFADATARTTALTGVIAEGMVSYLKDTNATEVYDGSAWVGIGNSGDITGVTAGTGISGGGTSGTVTITNSMATEITAAGDIIVGTGSGTFDNLPIGTTGQVLTADTTVSPYKVKWATAGAAGFVGCRLTKSSAQSISNATNTFITWDTESYDTDGFHSTSSNTSRITIPTGKGGKYLFHWTWNLGNNATGYRGIDLIKNGSTNLNASTLQVPQPTTGYNGGTASTICELVATDYVEIQFYQNSGGNLNWNSGTDTVFGCVYLGA